MNSWWICALSFLILCVSLGETAISCIDEGGNEVDWWVILKLPILPASSNAAAASGFAYAYADANMPAIKFTNQRLDQNLKGALGATLNQIYSNVGNEVAWLMWNDQTPDNKDHDSYGHTKGDIAFDQTSGFYLVHSVPRFPAPSSQSYTYPDYEKTYGQSLLCTTHAAPIFETISSQLLINKPYVYDSNLPASMSSSFPTFQAVLNKQWVKDPTHTVVAISTPNGYTFQMFAKNSESGMYLYENFTEPYYNSGMIWDTWENGANDNKMPTYCTPGYPYDSINVQTLSLGGDLTWPRTKEHSKWGITWSIPNIFCIGDINRQYSQAKRGGGTVCNNNGSMWRSFVSIIAKNDTCPY